MPVIDIKMADLLSLIENEIPEGRQNLQDSHTNLERVAAYCEGNYLQAADKRAALEDTKKYTTQSLASVAYQINTLAYNMMHLLDLQADQLAEMESQINHIAQTVMIHKEKVARREIGVLTTNKSTTRQHKILAPANPERPIKYIRKPIDYSILDDIGHGVKTSNATPRVRRTGSITGQPVNMIGPVNGVGGPAPNSKPPAPPQMTRSVGSISKGSREYRTPAPPIAPPTPPVVPSHYAPNFPRNQTMPSTQSQRKGSGTGYSSLPMLGMSQSGPPAPVSAPQIGMVYPQMITTQSPPPPPPPPPASQEVHQNVGVVYPGCYGPHPDLMAMSDHPAYYLLGHHKVETNPYCFNMDRKIYRPLFQTKEFASHTVSPPLPPPPPEHFAMFNDDYSQDHSYMDQERDNDLPDWVPRNYIEKVIAIYDYIADKEDELSFQENSVIYIIKKNDDGWCEGVLDGVTGLFPGNYVEPCL